MAYYITKIVMTTALILLISEIAKRSSFIGAFLASLPLVSVLAIVWLYIETKDISKISDLASSIFWLVLPSLIFFITLPMLLGKGIGFSLSLITSLILTILCYWLLITALTTIGIKL